MQRLAFQDREPDFDLVEPGGIGGREVQVHVGVVGQELRNALGLMRRKIVDDDVDFTTPAFERDELSQEGDELFSGVAGGGLTEDLAAFGVERGVK